MNTAVTINPHIALIFKNKNKKSINYVNLIALIKLLTKNKNKLIIHIYVSLKYLFILFNFIRNFDDKSNIKILKT